MKKAVSKKQPNILGTVLDIITVGAIYVLSQLVAGIVLDVGGVTSTDEIAEKPSLVLAAYFSSAIVIAGSLYLLISTYKIKNSELYLRRPSTSDLGHAIVAFLFYLVMTIFAGSILRLIPGINAAQRQDLGLDNISSGLLPLSFIALAVLPPLVEEFMFRGFLYQRLKSYRIGGTLSAVVVSVLFGLVHGQVNVAVDTFILSMIMIFAMEKRKSIWVAVFIHALKNTLAFLALFVFKWV